MTEPARDKWAEWVLRRQHGEDSVQHTSDLEFLRSIRDRVLDNAEISEGETLLDVGTGDGLIAFGALERLGENGQVILSDISDPLLDRSREFADEMKVSERCRFVRASADDLTGIEGSTVDVVTTRSVLIYVEDKRRAFEEVHRVLKPGGRLSVFEPINRFKYPEPPHVFMGYDVTPVCDLARKVRSVYESIQPANDPMLDFDERDLFDLAEDAGFEEVYLSYEAESKPGNPPVLDRHRDPWEALLVSAGNPKIPTLGEAMQQALTSDEMEHFTAHLRPLVRSGRRRETSAGAYLRAVKDWNGEVT